jgi:hypothetical protein
MWRGASDAKPLRKDRRRVAGRSTQAKARGSRCGNTQAHVCGGVAAWQLGADSNGRHGPNIGRPRSLRKRRCECGVANRKEKLRSEGDGWA